VLSTCLKHFGFVPRKDQPVAAVGAAVERAGLETVDRLGRKRRPHVLLMSVPSPWLLLLPPWGNGLFASTMLLDGGLEEVEEFLRRGQLLFEAFILLMELPVLFAEACVLLFQPRDSLHRREEALLQLGQPARCAIMPRFWQPHGAGSYEPAASRTRSTAGCRRKVPAHS